MFVPGEKNEILEDLQNKADQIERACYQLELAIRANAGRRRRQKPDAGLALERAVTIEKKTILEAIKCVQAVLEGTNNWIIEIRAENAAMEQALEEKEKEKEEEDETGNDHWWTSTRNEATNKVCPMSRPSKRLRSSL